VTTPTTAPDADDLLSLCAQRAPDLEGRSKRLWLLDGGACLVELVPSLRSFTHARDEMVDGTAALRLDFYEAVAGPLAAAGVPVAFRYRVDDHRYVADYHPAPPFEVIVKNVATGSTVRKYPGLFAEGHRFFPPVVKFDYRTDPEDEPIGEDYLRDLGVPVDRFRVLALRVNAVLGALLSPADLWDFCLVVGLDPRGEPSVISEISPDCMRLRDTDGRPLDKDLFRAGASHEEIVKVWRGLVGRIR